MRGDIAFLFVSYEKRRRNFSKNLSPLFQIFSGNLKQEVENSNLFVNLEYLFSYDSASSY